MKGFDGPYLVWYEEDKSYWLHDLEDRSKYPSTEGTTDGDDDLERNQWCFLKACVAGKQ